MLLDLSERVPRAWSLIGGQMVLLHGLEHGRTPPAASADLDVLADVQADQQSLRRLVGCLGDLGFAPSGMSPQGNLLHRYQRGEAPGLLVVDVLAPDRLGVRTDLTTTPPGRTLEVPGGRQAVQRTESVQVRLGARLGTIHRPSLLGAIIAKAAALSIKTAPPDRHYRDLAFLLSLPMNPLEMRSQLEKSDRKKLALATALHDPQHTAWRELRDDAAQADGHAAYAFLSSQ
ncbi:hypothetical protein [Kitasatospora phosalacinea]|uniref:Uncharacterized protein n=1 Tax=Kitasatospora phosalacinea TaxID=2065 RepID=A0A9W6PGV0_9ACTN|nr:hypothetical protein [Kitasatospora phosalacinea]GLW54683.1 hypothetical protein Kpho01_26940 [Kitasatospora phosalacinea]